MNKRKVQVSVFYCDEQNNKYFLLLKTNKRRGEFWQNITGGVDDGEDYEQGAIRELLEETSIKVDSLDDMNLEFNFIDQWSNNCIEKCYCIKLDTIKPVVIDNSEHSDFKWINFNDIKSDLIKYESNYQLIKKCSKL